MMEILEAMYRGFQEELEKPIQGPHFLEKPVSEFKPIKFFDIIPEDVIHSALVSLISIFKK